jgi:predicted protein tyrosine phosphatase
MMLASVDFISLREFESVAPRGDMAVISIGYPGDPVPPAMARFSPALRLTFLDNEPGDVAAQGIEHQLFSRKQAGVVLAFVRTLHAEPAARRLIVHCTVGASRSAAVALGAHAMTGCDFPRRAEANYANPHVVAVLAREGGLSVTIPDTPDGDHRYQSPALLI